MSFISRPRPRHARLLAVLTAFLVGLGFIHEPVLASDKKGIAMGKSFDADGQKLSALHVHWYYNWTLQPSSSRTAGCFVPMYWGKKGQLPELNGLSHPTPVLLTFNEPDFQSQSNRTVAEVLAEWPAVSAAATRVSAPTAARPFDKWMRQFMDEAGTAHLRADFVPVHWYGAPDAPRFLEFLDKLHELYRRPLWITEFAVADWHSTKYGSVNRFDEDKVVQFIRQVVPELEKRSYIERYAWLAADTPKESLRPSLLFDANGRLTKAGQAYAESGAHEPSDTACGAASGSQEVK
jgi:hypothetical protein